MKVNYPILMLFLLLISPFYLSSQQIQKGLTSINGSAQLNRTKYTYNLVNQLGLTPNYGKFVTNHLLLGVEANVYKESVYNGKYINQKYPIYGQYYFNPTKKWVFFSELMANYNSTYTIQQSWGWGNNLYDSKSLGLSIGLGFIHFLNKEVVLQGKVNFENYHYIGNLKKYDNTGGIKIGLNSFINFQDSSSFSKDHVGKGRRLFNADFSYMEEYYLSPITPINGRINYGKFLSKGLLLGISNEFGYDFDSPTFLDGITLLNIHFYTQYYQKVRNKLYAHIKAQTGLTATSYLGNLTFGFSGGFDYFLTPYTMIEANLVSYDRAFAKSSQYNYDAFSYGPQINIRYFLR